MFYFEESVAKEEREVQSKHKGNEGKLILYGKVRERERVKWCVCVSVCEREIKYTKVRVCERIMRDRESEIVCECVSVCI